MPAPRRIAFVFLTLLAPAALLLSQPVAEQQQQQYIDELKDSVEVIPDRAGDTMAVAGERVAMAWRTGFIYTDGMWDMSVADAPYSYYTHVVMSFIAPNPDGSLDLSINLNDLDTAVSLAHAVGTKVVIGLGDATGTGDYWQSATNDANRDTFAANLAAFIDAHDLDGADLDWEQQIIDSQYGAFMQVLRGTLGPGKLILVDAYGGNTNSPKAALVTGGGLSAVDQVNLMTYDMGVYTPNSWYNTAIHTGPDGEWSIEATINEFTSFGVPVSKLGIGIPFYGRKFPGDTGPSQANTHSGGISYKDIIFTGEVYDSTYGGQGVVNAGEWITYAGPQLINDIVAFGSSVGVGGFMAFPINQEDSGHSLSAALTDALFNAAWAEEIAQRSPTPFDK